MRDYSKVSGQFWTGKTGRALRGDMQTQIVAMYLLTSPHANMIGVFNCPFVYIAHETGSPLEGAMKGVLKLVELGFCTYDDDAEVVWVHEMAKFQIGDELKVADNRVKDIQKQYEGLSEGQIKQGFHAKYGKAYHLTERTNSTSPSEAPPKPLRSQKQEQKQEQKQNGEPSASASPLADIPVVKKSTPAIEFKTFMSSCKATGEDPVPENDPVFDWADKAGIPLDFLRIAWVEFRSRYLDSSKKYRDWRKVFRNAVRDNWFKLWFCDGSGAISLTTQGRLLQKTHDAEAA